MWRACDFAKRALRAYSTRLSLVLIAGVLSIVAGPTASGQEGFTRGIGIGHVLGWAPLDPARPVEFSTPTFAERERLLSKEELAQLAHAGFNFIRLAVDPGPFLRVRTSRQESLDNILLGHVRAILDAGLSVVVDLHPSDLHAQYTGVSLTTGLESELFARYLNELAHLSNLLSTVEPGRVALELMNEPPVPTARWQPMLEAAYAVVRSKAPGLPIILSGGDEGSIEGLLQLKTDRFRADPLVLFSFHYYDPYQFTHQGASWNAARFLAGVPYPADSRPIGEAITKSLTRIDQGGLPDGETKQARADAEKRLSSYAHSNFDRGTIDRAFARVEQWAQQHRIPASRIMLGEFGAIETELQRNGVGAAERRNWFRDVREEAERRGFAWAAWVYREEGGFSLTPPGASSIEPGILTALGLAAPRKNSGR